jgi:tRNA threonylcarbamoyladenosine biosynthesis protein TsaB
MLTLGIDCSSAACSVAIARDDALVASENSPMARGHAAALPPMIAAALNATRCHARDIDMIAVSTGPGSFTGLRVAMAAAKGLALSLDCPLIGISCFDAIARRATRGSECPDFDFLLLALASKREEIFIRGIDRQGMEILPDGARTPIEIDDHLGAMNEITDNSLIYLAGEAANPLGVVLNRDEARCLARVEIGPTSSPDAADIAILAYASLTSAPPKSKSYVPGLTPVYLRPTAASSS